MSRVAIFVLIYGLIFGYPWMRLITSVVPGFVWHPVPLAVLLCLPAVMWIASRKVAPPARYAIARVAYCWLGTSWLLLSLSLVAEPVYWLAPVAVHAYIGCALAGALVLLLAWSFWSAHHIQLCHEFIEHPTVAAPLRLVQLSDVHVGSRSSLFLERAVARAREAEPDLVLITGDLIDGMAVPQQDLASLATFKCPVYFAIGNHERYVDCEEICARLTNLGVNVLRDATTRVEIESGGKTTRIFLAGVDDADAPTQVGRVLPGLEKPLDDEYAILLYHRPDGLDAAAAHGINLMLCGHTHNGQLVPFNLLVKRRFPRIAGRYQQDNTTLYVSVGTGTWGPPMRLGSRNEITCLDLSPPATAHN